MWKRALIVTTLSLLAYHNRKRIIAALQSRALPSNPYISQWKRDATVCGLMHLAGNRPEIIV